MDKPVTILRTGVGSPPSMFTIRILQDMGVRVVGVDADKYSVGLYVCDASYHIPVATDDKFISVLVDICKKEQVDAILPAVDEELIVLSRNIRVFEDIGVKVIVSSDYAIDICLDKLKTYEFLVQYGIPVPVSFDAITNIPETYPVILKPRYGRGSKDIVKVRNAYEFEFFRRYIDQPVGQEYLDGDEYSVDILSDFTGKVRSMVSRLRIGTKAGVCVKGITRYHQKIVDYAAKIAEKLKLIGPSNIQCFLMSDGTVKFTEINPRLGGGAALSVKAGSNILSGLIKMIEGETIENCFKFQEGVVMLRYWEEIYIDEQDIISTGI
jgi:carbamoyl-phosphate synthase large subunit